MGGGPGGLGRRGGLGAVDEVAQPSRADWNSFPSLSTIPLITGDGVNRQLFEILGAQALTSGSTTSISSNTLTGNLALAVPFVVGDKRLLTGLALYTLDAHVAGSQAVQVAIYANRSDSFIPDARVYQSGSKPGVGVGGSGTTTIVMASGLALELEVGLYWAVVQVNAQWVTDGRTLASFDALRWTPGIFLQTAAGNANDPVPAQSHMVGWQVDAGSFTLPDPWPAGATPIYSQIKVPSILATWGPG